MKEINLDQSEYNLLPRLNVAGRQLFDLEMLLVDGFAPLTGFVNEDDYQGVVQEMRLASGELFPIPVVLDVPRAFEPGVGDQILLCDQFGNPLAVMNIESRFTPDKKKEVISVYGTDDIDHPGVRHVLHEMHPEYIGGTLKKIALPVRKDFTRFRNTPAELKKYFAEQGWDKVVGFQTRNPMHRAHFELVKRAHQKIGAPVLVHPVVGMTKPGDIDYLTRVRTYNVVCNTYGKDFTHLSLLPLSMRMAGPREAVWHAIIRKNYGCTHFIVGRDHAGPGSNAAGLPFYAADDARLLAEEHADEIGVEIVPSEELVFSKNKDTYVLRGELEEGELSENISGTEFRRLLQDGADIPSWFSFEESVEILRSAAKKDKRDGFVVFFTGLSGAGKTTIAELLHKKLEEVQDRSITFLDGDIIRDNLTKGLGFSKEDRDENVWRVGFVAAEVAKHGGIAVCSMISPYSKARARVRAVVEEYGNFIEVHVATSVEECERRDTKGLYKKARKGIIKEFTGISDPYEAPENPELVLDTEKHTADELVEQIVDYLQTRGVL